MNKSATISSTPPSADPLPTAQRLQSLDQFRGYTMLGMLLVNFCGSFSVCPQLLKHSHDYCSYADTIMPQFLFAVGFAMRLSAVRRWRKQQQLPWGRMVRRIGGLALLAIGWYSFCSLPTVFNLLQTGSMSQLASELGKRLWFQTLMHIAVTSLWLLPVIRSSPKQRLAWALLSASLHILLSWWFNFEWVHANPRGIDGGPFGFLSWAIPATVGTLACDLVFTQDRVVRRLMLSGVFLCVTGWGLSWPSVLYQVPTTAPNGIAQAPIATDPVIPSAARWTRWQGTIMELPFQRPPSAEQRQWNYWMMTQRAASISYTIFSAGCSLIVFGIFHLLSDRLGWQVPLFRTLGTNSLAAYLFHDIAGWIISPSVPGTATASQLTLACLIFIGTVWCACRLLEHRRWYIRL